MKQNQFHTFNALKSNKQRERLPNWMVFLMFLAYLRATQPAPSTALLVALIRTIAAILITLIIAQQGGSEVIAKVLSQLP